MKRNKIIALAITGALAFLSADAFACSTSLWNGLEQNNPSEGGPAAAPTTVRRYVGGCGLEAAAVGQTVTDNSPSAEGTYRVQFYTKPNVTSEADIFRAFSGEDRTGNVIIRVTHDGTSFRVYEGATASAPIAAPNNRWYQVQLNWAKATSVPGSNGKLGIKIQGNGGLVAAAPVQFNDLESATPALSGLANGASSIGSVALGWVAGGAGTSITTDAFESRRSTAINRACRGDSNGSGTITAGDRTAITNELGSVFTQTTAAASVPDCNEDGNITSADRTCITNLLTATAVCPTTF